MKNILQVVVVFLMVSSGCSRRTVPSSEVQRKDSVGVRESISFQDTTVIIAADSASISLPLALAGDTAKPVIVTTSSKKARITLTLSSNKVEAKCYCDSTEAKLKNTIKERNYFRMLSEAVSHTNIVVEKYIPWWAKALSWTGAVYLTATVMFIAFKLKV